MRAKLAYALGALLLSACANRGQQAPPVDNSGNDPKLTLAKSLVGTYHVVEVDGDASVGAMLDIVVQANQFGYQLRPLNMASQTVKAQSVLTDLTTSQLAAKNGVVTQEAQVGDTHTLVTYTPSDGYWTIDTVQCTKSTCFSTQSLISTGGAPGTAIDSQAFFQTVLGNYPIDLAGGKKPLEPTDVSVSFDSGEAIVGTPICFGGMCDPGTHEFPLAQTKVIRRELSRGGVQYVLFLKDGQNLRHYSWEEPDSTHFVFRNFQYKLKGDTVCLEHSFHK